MDTIDIDIAQFDNHIEALDTQYTSIDDEKVQTISTIKQLYDEKLDRIASRVRDVKYKRNAYIADLTAEHPDWMDSPELFAAVQHEALQPFYVGRNEVRDIIQELDVFSLRPDVCYHDLVTVRDSNDTLHNIFVPALRITSTTEDNVIDMLGPACDEYIRACTRTYAPWHNPARPTALATIYSSHNGSNRMYSVTMMSPHGYFILVRIHRDNGVEMSIKFDTMAELMRYIRDHIPMDEGV